MVENDANTIKMEKVKLLILLSAYNIETGEKVFLISKEYMILNF